MSTSSAFTRTIASSLGRPSSVREEAQPFLFDHRIVLPDGGVRWTQSRGRVVTDHEGRPLRMVGTAQDVTERKQPRFAPGHDPRDRLARAEDAADGDPRLRHNAAGARRGDRARPVSGAPPPPGRTGRATRPPPDGSPGSRPTPSRLPDPGVRGDRRLRARRADHEHARSRGAVRARGRGRRAEGRANRRQPARECPQAHAGGNGRQRPWRATTEAR